jgi:hypothetical protein
MGNSILTIDPGQRTGVALWSIAEWKKQLPPMCTDYWSIPSCDRVLPWGQRCNLLAEKLGIVLNSGNIHRVYCEMPAFFESHGGMAAATKGDLIKLTYLVGVYAGICHIHRVRFTPVPVVEWKGQLPKEIVKKRILKKLGRHACQGYHGDIWDAVGIGLHVKGYGL